MQFSIIYNVLNICLNISWKLMHISLLSDTVMWLQKNIKALALRIFLNFNGVNAVLINKFNKIVCN